MPLDDYSKLFTADHLPHIQAKTQDGESISGEHFYIFTFTPGTTKILKVVEMLDSRELVINSLLDSCSYDAPRSCSSHVQGFAEAGPPPPWCRSLMLLGATCGRDLHRYFGIRDRRLSCLISWSACLAWNCGAASLVGLGPRGLACRDARRHVARNLEKEGGRTDESYWNEYIHTTQRQTTCSDR
jgi:hypothetical protein